MAEKVHHAPEHLRSLGEGMDGDGPADVVQRYCREQPRQTQEVVAVEVGNKDVGNLCKRKAVAAQLQLSALAAVNQHQAPAVVEHLGAGEVSQGGRSRPYSEICHTEITHIFADRVQR